MQLSLIVIFYAAAMLAPKTSHAQGLLICSGADVTLCRTECGCLCAEDLTVECDGGSTCPDLMACLSTCFCDDGTCRPPEFV